MMRGWRSAARRVARRAQSRRASERGAAVACAPGRDREGRSEGSISFSASRALGMTDSSGASRRLSRHIVIMSRTRVTDRLGGLRRQPARRVLAARRGAMFGRAVEQHRSRARVAGNSRERTGAHRRLWKQPSAREGLSRLPFLLIPRAWGVRMTSRRSARLARRKTGYQPDARARPIQAPHRRSACMSRWRRARGPKTALKDLRSQGGAPGASSSASHPLTVG